MDAKKMIEELTTECNVLDSKRSAIVSQAEEIIRKVKANMETEVRKIDDELTAYRMAIESLEMTVKPAETKQIPVVKAVQPVETAAPATRKVRKDAKLIEFNGKAQSYAQWEKETGINRYTLSYRIDHGWSVEDALTTPINEVFSAAAKKKVEQPKNMRAMPRKVFAYDQHGNVVRQFIGIGEASRELHMPIDVIEKTITAVPKQDQLKSRNYYLAFAG